MITIPPPRTEWEEAKTEVGRETAARMEGATVTVGMVAAKLPPEARMTAAVAAVTEEEGGKLAREGTSGVWNKAERKKRQFFRLQRVKMGGIGGKQN